MAAFNVQLKRATGSSWDDVFVKTTWNLIDGKPTTFTPTQHLHNASDINSGTLADARIPNLAISKITNLQTILDGKAPYQVLTSVDPNSVITPGIYTLRSVTVNRPGTGSYYSLIVLKSDNGSYVHQIAIQESTRKMYVRYQSGGTWNAWTRMLSAEDFSLSGSTLTITTT